MMYFSGLACIGIFFNVWLYMDDLRNRNGVLDKVDQGENLKDLMSTPTNENNRRKAVEAMAQPDDNAEMEMNLDEKPYQYS